MAPALSDIGSDDLRRAALSRVPGCEAGQAPVTVTPLHGGTSNATFHVQTRLGSFVLRLNEPESTTLGIDRQREAVLHAAAARSGLAPAIVHADAQGRFLITEYMAGKIWSAHDMDDWSRLASLAATLRQLHAIPAPRVSTFDLAALLQQHVERALRTEISEREYLNALLRRALSVLSGSQSRAACVVHNDLHHSNLIGAGGRVYLVDWEYAGIADPLSDLGCLLAYYPRAAPHAAALLQETGLSPVASLAELNDIAWTYTLVSYLWYRTRRVLAPASSQDLEMERVLRMRLDG